MLFDFLFSSFLLVTSVIFFLILFDIFAFIVSVFCFSYSKFYIWILVFSMLSAGMQLIKTQARQPLAVIGEIKESTRMMRIEVL